MDNKYSTEVIKCKKCQKQMMVPTDKGELKVTCPYCGDIIYYKPESLNTELREKKSKRNKMPFVAIAVIVIIVIAYFVLSGNNKNDAVKNDTYNINFCIDNYQGKWVEDWNDIYIEKVNDKEITFSFTFYRLYGLSDVIATLVDDNSAIFEADDVDKKITGKLLFEDNSITMELDDQSNFYDDSSLSEFLDGTNHIYKRFPQIISKDIIQKKDIKYIKSLIGNKYDMEGPDGEEMLWYDYLDLGFTFDPNGKVCGIHCDKECYTVIDNQISRDMTFDEIKKIFPDIEIEHSYTATTGEHSYYAYTIKDSIVYSFEWGENNPQDGSMPETLDVFFAGRS